MMFEIIWVIHAIVILYLIRPNLFLKNDPLERNDPLRHFFNIFKNLINYLHTLSPDSVSFSLIYFFIINICYFSHTTHSFPTNSKSISHTHKPKIMFQYLKSLFCLLKLTLKLFTFLSTHAYHFKKYLKLMYPNKSSISF